VAKLWAGAVEACVGAIFALFVGIGDEVVLVVPAAVVVDEVVVGAAGEAELGGGAVEAPRRAVEASFC
jgi:hypothetical protein